MNKTTSNTVYFQPTFGNRPEQIVGRDGELHDFLRGLDEIPGSRERCTLILGQRGMGKTALLLEIADRAINKGFVVARVTAHEGMPQAIIEQIQLNGSQYFSDKRSVTGVTAGALGFSFGLSFSEPAQQQFGFRTKLSMLCDRLAEKNKGVVILIDEVLTSPAMREVAASYQELVGEQKNIAMVMAGLPAAVSGVLNDKVLTFLNRAKKVELGEISVSAIKAYYTHAFKAMGIACSERLLEQAADLTRGLPYLMQLIGYYLSLYSQDTSKITNSTLRQAESASMKDMENNVFRPILSPLSDNDLLFLNALSKLDPPAKIADLQKEIGEKGPAIQPYRKRLMDAGIIESPRRGELVFTVPYLKEYLMEQAMDEE